LSFEEFSFLAFGDRDSAFWFECRRLWPAQFCCCATVVFPSLGISGASVGLSAKASELTKQAVNANVIWLEISYGIPSIPWLTRS
jgi:hypothetical protein